MNALNPTSSGILQKILRFTRRRVRETQRLEPLHQLKARAEQASAVPALRQAFLGEAPAFIAEVKPKSPSSGRLNESMDPVALARSYIENGAGAVSVLTEPYFFGGEIHFLERIRQALPKSRLLMKDFIVDEYQIFQARASGASGYLLLASIYSADELEQLIQTGRALGLTALVEVDSLQGLQKAHATSAELIGVNNRNLRTLEVDPQNSFQLAEDLDPERTYISESGIQSASLVNDLQSAGYRGFLVGTHLMKSGDPGKALRDLGAVS